MTQPATEGSHLLYTYQAADHCKRQSIGQARPAVVVRAWGSDMYNVMVLTDGRNDFEDGRHLLHLTSVQLGECPGKGRLHYAGSPLEPEAPQAPQADPEPAQESSAPEGAQSPVAPDNTGGESQAGEAAPATPEAPKILPKRKPGRPKKVAAK